MGVMAKRRTRGKEDTKLPPTVPFVKPVNKPSEEEPSRAFNPPMERMEAFVNTYRRTFNGTKAAIAAGYSPTNARSAGSHMLRHPVVQELLAQRIMESAASTTVNMAEVIQALNEIAMVDIGELFAFGIRPSNGRMVIRLRAIPLLPKHVRRAIASIKVIKKNLIAGDGEMDELYEVKFWNKNDALHTLANIGGALNQKVEHIVKIEQVKRMSDDEVLALNADVTEKLRRHMEAKRMLIDAAQDAEVVEK